MPGLIKYTVAKSPVPVVENNPAIGYRLKITCDEFVGGPDAAIFCFKRVSADLAVFSHVASYADMEAYGVGAPVDADVPFFRAAVVDMVFANVDLREETLGLILADFGILTAGVDTTSELSDIYSGAVPEALPLTEINGIITGTGADTYRVEFPAAVLSTPKVFAAASGAFGVTITPDLVGFDLVASRVLTPADTVSWHLG